MTDQRITYPTDEGGVAVIIPSPEWLAQPGNTLEALAAKDVPPRKRAIPTGEFAVDEDTGETYEVHTYVTEPRPWQIVDAADIPADRTFRAAWEYVS
jgi:hypothetical protein